MWNSETLYVAKKLGCWLRWLEFIPNCSWLHSFNKKAAQDDEQRMAKQEKCFTDQHSSIKIVRVWFLYWKVKKDCRDRIKWPILLYGRGLKKIASDFHLFLICFRTRCIKRSWICILGSRGERVMSCYC